MTNKNIIAKKTADLIPYVNNARQHSDYQIGLIANSISQFGFNVPIIIDNKNNILAGHGRLLAAQKLKLEQVPTIELSHLTKAQKKSFILADNKISDHATWDDEILFAEFDTIKELDLDINFADFGFDDKEPKDNENSMEDFNMDVFNLVVEFENETDLQALFNELKRKGFKCRPHII